MKKAFLNYIFYVFVAVFSFIIGRLYQKKEIEAILQEKAGQTININQTYIKKLLYQ